MIKKIVYKGLPKNYQHSYWNSENKAAICVNENWRYVTCNITLWFYMMFLKQFWQLGGTTCCWQGGRESVPPSPLWRFLNLAKSFKRAPKTALLISQGTPLGVFASRKREWPRRHERFNCLSLPVGLHLVWLWVLGA